MKLYKKFLIALMLLSIYGCEEYYKNDENPWRVGECSQELYSSSSYDKSGKKDVYGETGATTKDEESPRVGIDNVYTHNNNRRIGIEGRFASLCKSSMINGVKIELYNGKGGVRKKEPDINIGYSGNFSWNIDMNKNHDNRCFFHNADITIKTWAKSKDKLGYYAHVYSKTPTINVKSDIPWFVDDYDYRNRIEIKNEYLKYETKYETEYKYEDREVSDINYTYKYKYVYTYEYKYTYGDKYRYKFPTKLFIYAKNDYPGNYDKMNVNNDSYSISNDNRRVGFTIGGNSKIKRGVDYNFKISFIEKLNSCEIESLKISKDVSIPSETLDGTFIDVLIKTDKTLENTNKTFVSRERKI